MLYYAPHYYSVNIKIHNISYAGYLYIERKKKIVLICKKLFDSNNQRNKRNEKKKFKVKHHFHFQILLLLRYIFVK